MSLPEIYWHAYSNTLHLRGFDSERENIHADCYFPNADKRGVNITFTYVVITHLAALTPLSVSTHYMFVRRISLHCILAFHDRVPVSPLIPYNTKFGDERAALVEHLDEGLEPARRLNTSSCMFVGKTRIFSYVRFLGSVAVS